MGVDPAAEILAEAVLENAAGVAYSIRRAALALAVPPGVNPPMSHEKWNALALVAGVLVLALAGPWLAREIGTLRAARAVSARANQRIVSLEVGGMTCSGGASSIRSTLEEVPGVSTVEVRYRERRAFVVCDRGVADSTLTTAVHRAGPGFLAAVAAR